MSARERILAGIRARQGKPDAAGEAELESVRSYVTAHARSAAPRNVFNPQDEFRDRALSLASTVALATNLAEVPAVAAQYLRERKLPMHLVCWPELSGLDWGGSGIAARAGSARSDDLIGVTGAFCAIAETGTLMTLSGPATPPSASLLPETHIAVLRCDRIVRSMEDAWDLLRREHKGMPRAVSFISGPSRTADIEQTVTLGAHGPYRVHIILVLN